MSNVRVTYSGLIALVVGLSSIIVGMTFVLIVTRRLSAEEFGTWSLIGSILSYFLVSEIIISFWSTRQIARGKNVGKTSVTSSLILGIGLIPIYLIYVFAIAENSDVNLEILMFGSLLLPVYFLSKTIAGVNLAHKPQAVSYGLMIYEIVKIPIALTFVVVYELGVIGVIIAVLLAYLIRIGLQMYFAKDKLKNKFNFVLLKNWTKLSWVVLYSTLPSYVRKIDMTIFLIITNSVIGVANYSAALVISTVIANSNLISQGLYAKLLADGSKNYVRENFIHTMYFAIPLLSMSIIFAKPALFALNPIYQGAILVVILLSIRAFFYIPQGIFVSSLKALEKVDENDDITVRKLIQSNLFSIPTVQLIQAIAYIAMMIIGISIGMFTTDIELITWWALSSLLLEIPFSIYWWNRIQKKISFSFPVKELSKYSIAALGLVAIFFMTSDQIINYEISIYDFLPSLIVQFIICAVIYVVITYIIDERTRRLVKSVINEFSKKN